MRNSRTKHFAILELALVVNGDVVAALGQTRARGRLGLFDCIRECSRGVSMAARAKSAHSGNAAAGCEHDQDETRCMQTLPHPNRLDLELARNRRHEHARKRNQAEHDCCGLGCAPRDDRRRAHVQR